MTRLIINALKCVDYCPNYIIQMRVWTHSILVGFPKLLFFIWVEIFQVSFYAKMKYNFLLTWKIFSTQMKNPGEFNSILHFKHLNWYDVYTNINWCNMNMRKNIFMRMKNPNLNIHEAISKFLIATNNNFFTVLKKSNDLREQICPRNDMKSVGQIERSFTVLMIQKNYKFKTRIQVLIWKPVTIPKPFLHF